MKDRGEFFITLLNGFAFGMSIAGLLFSLGVPPWIITWSSICLSIVVITVLRRRMKKSQREFEARMEAFINEHYGYVRAAGDEEWTKIQ